MPTSSVTLFLSLLSLTVSLCSSEDEYSVAKMREISAAKESAVVAVGMIDVLSVGRHVVDFLESHTEYAAEFGRFAVYAVDLATTYLGMCLA